MLPRRPTRPPNRDDIPNALPPALVQTIRVPTMGLRNREKAFIKFPTTVRQDADLNLGVPVGKEERSNELDNSKLQFFGHEDKDVQPFFLREGSCSTIDGESEQEERTQNPWHKVRKTKSASNGWRHRPLVVDETKFEGAITIAVVSRSNTFTMRDAGTLLDHLEGLLLKRYEDEDLLNEDDWLRVRLAFTPELNTRKTLVYMHFESFLRDKVGYKETLNRDLVLCGRGLPEDFEETGLSLANFIPDYQQGLKLEAIISKDDPLYLILYLLAKDIYIRNIQPIWLKWSNDTEFGEPDREEEVATDYGRNVSIRKSGNRVAEEQAAIWDERNADSTSEEARAHEGDDEDEYTRGTSSYSASASSEEEDVVETDEESYADDSSLASSDAETTILAPTRRRPRKRIVSGSSYSSVKTAPNTAGTEIPDSWGEAGIVKRLAYRQRQRNASGCFMGRSMVKEAKESTKRKWGMPTISGPGIDTDEEPSSNRTASGTWRQRRTIRSDSTQVEDSHIVATVEISAPPAGRKLRKSGGQVLEDSTSEDEPLGIKKARTAMPRLITLGDSTDYGVKTKQAVSNNAKVSAAKSARAVPCPFDEESSDEHDVKRVPDSKCQGAWVGDYCHKRADPRRSIRKSSGMATDSATDDGELFDFRVEPAKKQLAVSSQSTPSVAKQRLTEAGVKNLPRPVHKSCTKNKIVARPSVFGSASTLKSVESKIRPDLVGRPKVLARRLKHMPDIAEIMRDRLKKSSTSRKRALLGQSNVQEGQSLFVKKRRVEATPATCAPTNTTKSIHRRVFVTGELINNTAKDLDETAKQVELTVLSHPGQGLAMLELQRQEAAKAANVSNPKNPIGYAPEAVIDTKPHVDGTGKQLVFPQSHYKDKTKSTVAAKDNPVTFSHEKLPGGDRLNFTEPKPMSELVRQDLAMPDLARKDLRKDLTKSATGRKISFKQYVAKKEAKMEERIPSKSSRQVSGVTYFEWREPTKISAGRNILLQDHVTKEKEQGSINNAKKELIALPQPSGRNPTMMGFAWREPTKITTDFLMPTQRHMSMKKSRLG